MFLLSPVGKPKHGTTLNHLSKTAYQNLQGEKRNQNRAVPNICKFDYSRYDFLDRSCLPHDTCGVKYTGDLLLKKKKIYFRC